MKKTILNQQERIIQENNGALLLLAKNKVDIMNEVARANHEIDELKTKLAKKNSLLKNSQDFQDTLLLQAEKLRFEKEQISQRCENVINKMSGRLRVKENVIAQVREDIEKYIKLQQEVRHRNEVLRGRLEKREKIVDRVERTIHELSTTRNITAITAKRELIMNQRASCKDRYLRRN